MNKLVISALDVPTLSDWIPGHTDNELAKHLTELTGSPVTREQAKNWRNRHNIPLGKREIRKSTIYPDGLMKQIREWTPGHTDHELAAYLSALLKRPFTRKQAKQFRQSHRIPIGANIEGGGRWEKGHIPWSKGRKLEPTESQKRTQFKTGNKPHNYLPIGSKVKAVMRDGTYFWKVKTADPDQWEFIHRKTWEEVNGPIPDDSCICFLDGNRDNCSIDNLKCIKKGILSQMNRSGLWTSDQELTETAINVATLKNRVNKLKKERKEA